MPRRKRAAFVHPAQMSFADLLFGMVQIAQVAKAGSGDELAVPAAPPSPFSLFVPVYGVKLVQTASVLWHGEGRGDTDTERATIASPGAAVSLLEAHLLGADREHFALVLLDAKNRVIGINTVSVGDLCSSLAHPREVFKPAILANAASVLLFHNHPSGSPEPSPEDVQVTRRLSEVGTLLGIDVLDHVILGDRGRYVSLRERGLHDFQSGPTIITGEGATVAPAGYSPLQPF